MKEICSEQLQKSIKNLCEKGKHKFRENKFGVTWCVRCGCLSTSIGFADKLADDDKILVINNKQI